MGELKLIATYALPVAVIVWLWLRPGSLKTKLLITLFLPGIYFLHWSALHAIKGWPVDRQLPVNFQLLAADISEPAQNKNGKGYIHLWIRTRDAQHPRAYQLPYSRSLHQQIHDARQRMENGHVQLGYIRDERERGGGAAIGGGKKLEFRSRRLRHLPPKKLVNRP